MICSHQLRALGKLTVHYTLQREANVPQTGTSKCLWMSGRYQNFIPSTCYTEIWMNSTKLNETLKLQTKLLLSMKSSQPQQDFFFFCLRGIFIFGTLSLFITGTLQDGLLSSFIHTVSHFLFIEDFFLFLAILRQTKKRFSIQVLHYKFKCFLVICTQRVPHIYPLFFIHISSFIWL